MRAMPQCEMLLSICLKSTRSRSARRMSSHSSSSQKSTGPPSVNKTARVSSLRRQKSGLRTLKHAIPSQLTKNNKANNPKKTIKNRSKTFVCFIKDLLKSSVCTTTKDFARSVLSSDNTKAMSSEELKKLSPKIRNPTSR
jgi:hypothetical protein